MLENTNESRHKWKQGWGDITVTMFGETFVPEYAGFIFNIMYNNLDWTQYFCNPMFNHR